jgi:hypothetical protein
VFEQGGGAQAPRLPRHHADSDRRDLRAPSS